MATSPEGLVVSPYTGLNNKITDLILRAKIKPETPLATSGEESDQPNLNGEYGLAMKDPDDSSTATLVYRDGTWQLEIAWCNPKRREGYQTLTFNGDTLLIHAEVDFYEANQDRSVYDDKKKIIDPQDITGLTGMMDEFVTPAERQVIIAKRAERKSSKGSTIGELLARAAGIQQ
jgi:hypothetical protein